MSTRSLYLSLIGASLASQLAYRRSFVLQLVGTALITAGELTAVFFLFNQFPDIKGWTVWEVLLLFGLAECSFSVVQTLFPGLERMARFVKQGEFDRVLLRPMSPLLQVCSTNIALVRLGRLSQGILALALASYHLNISWGATELGMALIAFTCSAVVYFSLFTINAAATFWTVEGDEAFNAFTYGGVQLTQFPIAIYPSWVRGMFLFLIPIGFVSYYPAVYLLGKDDPLGMPAELAFLAPLAAGLFLVSALLFWRSGVNHYQSTGS